MIDLSAPPFATPSLAGLMTGAGTIFLIADFEIGASPAPLIIVNLALPSEAGPACRIPEPVSL